MEPISETSSIHCNAMQTLVEALTSCKEGDFTVRLNASSPDLDALQQQVFSLLNDVMCKNEILANELKRIENQVGKEGHISERVVLKGNGSWKQCMESINNLMTSFVQPTTELMHVINAVAQGDLTKRVNLSHNGIPLCGDFLQLGSLCNAMVDQLDAITNEVTRVSREVGVQGHLRAHAHVEGVALGTWKDLIDNINTMVATLAAQVQDIVAVTAAVSNGDLSKKVMADVNGEILELKKIINNMVDQLNSYTSEVTRVVCEVGTEGKLGGQAIVPGVRGTWRDLTHDVNSMVAKLTTQVRAIAEFGIAMTKGDFTQTLTFEACGELATLKTIFNEMMFILKESQLRLTAAKAEINAATRVKAEFAAIMAHEIRTPMNSIIGMTELILNTGLTAGQRDSMLTVQSSANTLLSIINDIVDFHALEAGKVDLGSDIFSLRAILGNTLKALAPSAHSKELEFICDIQSEIPDRLEGDPARLSQVVANLIGNAIKFTQRGEVALIVEMVSADDNSVTLHFTVSDTGIGIPSDKLSTVFEALSHSDTSHKLNHDGAGVGLGLAIASGIVELMGGQLRVESVVNRGSVFHFTVCFPLCKDNSNNSSIINNSTSTTNNSSINNSSTINNDNSTINNDNSTISNSSTTNNSSVNNSSINNNSSVNSSSVNNSSNNSNSNNKNSNYNITPHCLSPPAHLRGMKALIVDDNNTVRSVLHKMLTSWHMVPTVAESGEVAQSMLMRSIADKKPFQLVLLDAHMPGVDGFSVAEFIRNIPQLSLATVVMMINSGPFQGSISPVVSAYLPKPVIESDLIASLTPRPVKLQTMASSTQTQANILLAEDNVVNQKLAIRLLDKLGYRVTLATNGAQAVAATEKRRYDLILMDEQMPEMGGFEATAKIREREKEKGGHTPIIGMAAYSVCPDRKNYIGAGMDDYLSKPIHAGLLKEMLEKFLKSS